MTRCACFLLVLLSLGAAASEPRTPPSNGGVGETSVYVQFDYYGVGRVWDVLGRFIQLKRLTEFECKTLSDTVLATGRADLEGYDVGGLYFFLDPENPALLDTPYCIDKRTGRPQPDRHGNVEPHYGWPIPPLSQ